MMYTILIDASYFLDDVFKTDLDLQLYLYLQGYKNRDRG